MEFNVPEWTQFFLRVLTEDDTMDSQDSVVSSSEKRTSTTFNEKSTQTMENNAQPNQTTDRNYCLIIFNNPKWSEILQQRRQRQQAHSYQQQEHICNKIDSCSSIGVQHEHSNRSLDDEFIVQLRKLLNTYMQHTTRPFPLKYFLDLTDH